MKTVASRARIGDVRGGSALPGLAKRVAAGDLDPYVAAHELVVALRAPQAGPSSSSASPA